MEREVDRNRQEAMAQVAEELDHQDIMNGLDKLIKLCHTESRERGWWDNGYNFGEKAALIHSEVSEALEGDRKDLMDDKLPEYKMVAVEFADAIIRIADLIGYIQSKAISVDEKNQYDMSKALIDKVMYNRKRKDHDKSHRESTGGKKY